MKRQANASEPAAAANKTTRRPAAKKSEAARKKTTLAEAAKPVAPVPAAGKPRAARVTRTAAIAAAAQRASDALPADAPPPQKGVLREQLVRERAYAFYLSRDCADGHEVEDWLRAEAEVDELLTRLGAP